MSSDEEQHLGLREQKKRQTRRAIRSAALDLALADGIEKLTVEAIAQTAGVSPRTFFNYFASKEDALVTEAAEGAAQVRELLSARPTEEPPLEALRQAILISDYWGTIPGDRNRLLARQRLTQENSTLLTHHLGKIAQVERTFAEALADRMNVDPGEDMLPELIAALAVSVIRVAVRRWTGQDSQPLSEFIDAAFEQIQHVELYSAEPASAG